MRWRLRGVANRFALQSTGIACRAAVLPQHAVAGHHHAQRVAPHGSAHGAHGGWAADISGQCAVAGGLPGAIDSSACHTALLKGGAARHVQRQVEPRAVATQVLLQLCDGGLQNGLPRCLGPAPGPSADGAGGAGRQTTGRTARRARRPAGRCRAGGCARFCTVKGWNCMAGFELDTKTGFGAGGASASSY